MLDYRTFIDMTVVRRPTASQGLGNDAVDWLATIARCNDEFVATGLLTAMRETGAVDGAPEDAVAYLRLLSGENARRNGQLRAQCERMGATLSAAGLEAVLLKGAAWLFQPGPAVEDRMMRDIDVLVPPEQGVATIAALQAAGYRPKPGYLVDPGHVHEAPLLHPDGAAGVEVHVELTTRPALLACHEVFAASIVVAPGLRIPSPEHRIVHNVLHAQIVNGDYVGGVASLRDSLDLARLADDAGSSLDWASMTAVAKARGYYRVLSGALHVAARFAGATLPAELWSDRRGRLHAWRCEVQRRNRLADWVLRRIGIAGRALAWERDSYALGLGEDRGPRAHLMVNRRRVDRIVQAIRRATGRG